MNKIEKLATELNKDILNQEMVKEYQKYETLIKNNQEISKLEVKMKHLQKVIVNKKAKQDESVNVTIKEYQEIKDRFENHPLVVNYLYLKNEVDLLLQDIDKSINGLLALKD